MSKRQLLKNNKIRVVSGDKESDQIKLDLGNAQALKVLHDTEGGQLLIKSLVQDVVASVGRLTISPDTILHVEFIAIAVGIKERLAILEVLTGADNRQQLLKEVLTTILKEENPG